MKKTLTLWIALILSFSSFAYTTFIAPSPSTELTTSFRITLSYYGSTNYTIEIFDNASYTGPAIVSSYGPYSIWVSGLNKGSTYYARGTSDNSPVGYYTYLTLTTSSSVPYTTPTMTNGTYLNSNPYFYTSSVSGASSYDWEIDTTSTFNSAAKISKSTSVNSVQISPRYTLLSGARYYVRTRAILNGETGPWTQSGNVKYFYAELHPATVASPSSGTLNKNGFKVWLNTVENATNYDIQVSTVSSFSTILYTISPTTNYSSDPNYFAFDYLGNTQSPLNWNSGYYIRARARNTNGQTSPYSSSVFVNTGSPVINLTNVTNGATIAPTTKVYLTLSSSATNYNLQISTNSSFTNIIYNATQTSRLFDITSVTNYGITLYARGRINGLSFIGSITNFIIDGTPTAAISSPSDGSSITYGTNFYSSSNYPSSQLTWYYEADTVSSFNSSSLIAVSTTNNQGGTGLGLKSSRTYYVKVRAMVTSSGVYSAWSTPITVNTTSIGKYSALGDPNQNDLSTNFSLYPNPGNEKVILNGPASGEIDKIYFIDLQGKEYSVNEESGVIDIEYVPSGIYLVKISLKSGELLTDRFIKL